ncbi:MAG: Holliday junction resolvase RuvX [Phycisphaerales bacterium]
MRYLSIDHGERRVGLALGDDSVPLVTPIGRIERSQGPRSEDHLIDALLRAVREHAADAIVIGLPLNMDGSEGPAAQASRRLGEQLGPRCGLVIHYQDERLTSFAADQAMNQSGRTHKQKKKLRDALAACAILEDFLRRVS